MLTKEGVRDIIDEVIILAAHSGVGDVIDKCLATKWRKIFLSRHLSIGKLPAPKLFVNHLVVGLRKMVTSPQANYLIFDLASFQTFGSILIMI